MNFPIEIQEIINDYARPMTRPDWFRGSYISRRLTKLPNLKGQLAKQIILRAVRFAELPDDDDTRMYGLFYFDDILEQFDE
jgi:hypothetical protein